MDSSFRKFFAKEIIQVAIYPDENQLKSAVDKYVQTNYKDNISFCKFLQGFALFIFSFRVFVFVFFGLFLKFFLLIYFISALCENRTLTFWHFARKPTQTFLALRDFFGICKNLSQFLNLQERELLLQRNEDMGLCLFFFFFYLFFNFYFILFISDFFDTL